MPRDRLIQVKVSALEKEAIRERASSLGLHPSQYLRARGLQIELGTPAPAVEAPIPHSTQYDRESKAKVRQAVEDEEPYEVKIEPGTIQLKARLSDDEIRARAKALVVEKGIRYQVAYAQVVKEAAE